jgi:hypothetical protein
VDGRDDELLQVTAGKGVNPKAKRHSLREEKESKYDTVWEKEKRVQIQH